MKQSSLCEWPGGQSISNSKPSLGGYYRENIHNVRCNITRIRECFESWCRPY